MNKLLAIILSFGLITGPVSFAEEIDVGENASYDQQSQIKNGGYDFYAKQVLTLGTSIVGSNIVSQCSFGVKIPSIATYMAGSIVHIASEILGARAQNEYHNKKMDDLKRLKESLAVEGGEIQKQILIHRKQEEENNLKFIKDRKLWMMAVTAIYMTAAGFAVAEQIGGHVAGVANGTSTCGVTSATLSAGCTVGYAACVAGHVAACMSSMSSGAIAAEASFATPTAPASGATACAGTAIYSPGCTAYLASYMAVGYANCTPLSADGGFLNQMKSMAIVSAYTMGVGQTGGQMASYGAMLSSLLMMIVPKYERLVMASYNFPIPRTVTFGASSVLSGAVTAGLIQRQNIAEDNIKNLDKVLSEFRSQTDEENGIGTDGGHGEEEVNKSGFGQYALKKLAKVTPVKNCMMSQGKTFEISEKACRSPVRIQKPSFDFKSGVQTLNDAGTLANTMANAISSGDMGSAKVTAEKLGNMIGKLKEVNKNLQAKYNKQQKANGKAPIDFDKSVKDQVASMEASLNSAAASKGIDLASLGTPETSLEEPKKEVSLVTTIAPAREVKVPSPDLGLGGLDIDMGEPQPEKVATLEESLEGFESTTTDIAKDPGVSIFRQVSNRYILNYSKIFNRKNIETTVPEKESDLK